MVIHCTELPDLATAREFGERIHHESSRTGNCGHFYIDRDGRTEQWAPLHRIAHHIRGFNERSIGIELVNLGRYPRWLESDRQDVTEQYPETQISALIELIRQLAMQHTHLRWISGHQHLDRESVPASDDPAILVQRKIDPGPLFPWPRIKTSTPLKFVKKLPA